MDEEKEFPIPWKRKWISKEEAKEMWPDNPLHECIEIVENCIKDINKIIEEI